MQGLGHIIANNKKILVLVRENTNPKNPFRSLKMRKSGKDGVYFEDESIFLEKYPETLKRLLKGEVIKL